MHTQIAKRIAVALNNELSVNDIQNLLERPKNLGLGDVAFPCFTLAKIKKISKQYRIRHKIQFKL